MACHLAGGAWFALLHGPEYQWAWQQLLVVGLAGVAFGYVRYKTGSTTARRSLLHSAYNVMGFLGYTIMHWQSLQLKARDSSASSTPLSATASGTDFRRGQRAQFLFAALLQAGARRAQIVAARPGWHMNSVEPSGSARISWAKSAAP